MKTAGALIVASVLVLMYYVFIGVPAWGECRAGGGSWQLCIEHLVR